MGGSRTEVNGALRGHDRVAAAIEALRARRGTLEDELLARIHAISDSAQVAEQEYVVRLRTAVRVGVDFAFDAMRACDVGGRIPQVPTQLLVQAHLAARNEVSLDTVLRRYCSGHTLVVDALLQEGERGGLSRGELKTLMEGLAAGLDSVLARVSDEYTREVESRPAGGGQRRVELARSVLAGERADAPELKYSFDDWHVGFVCAAPEPSSVAREIASRVDRALLLVSPCPELCWAWVGGRRRFSGTELETLVAAASAKGGAYVAFGEPAMRVAGWRLSHRQAVSALSVARRSPARVSRYSEVSLLSSAIKDELLARSLRQLFLEPLEDDRDGGHAAKQTLRAYFDASRNVSSAAVALGVSRRTIAKRLAAIEQRVGRPLDRFAAEIETAVRLEEFEANDRAR